MSTTINQFPSKVERLKDLLISRATGGAEDDNEYRLLRSDLLANPRIKSKLPDFVISCRDLGSFWDYIKTSFSTYAERRGYLRREFDPALIMLELEPAAPADQVISAMLSSVNSEHVQEVWQRALERRTNDPEGAITLARTLLESVSKHVLDESNAEYGNEDLPKLYRKAAEQLSLAPSQHTEEVFRQILGSCQGVVEGLGTLRNRLSDAHGRGVRSAKPAPRHAELAVNLAGSMATFLIATVEARNSKHTCSSNE